jgi:NAD(P)-dependent dehydrogenase (short-subunit alcohol dehydrogenase family)
MLEALAAIEPKKTARMTAPAEPSQKKRPMPQMQSNFFLASADASYMTGQVLHPNGGEIVNG